MGPQVLLRVDHHRLAHLRDHHAYDGDDDVKFFTVDHVVLRSSSLIHVYIYSNEDLRFSFSLIAKQISSALFSST